MRRRLRLCQFRPKFAVDGSHGELCVDAHLAQGCLKDGDYMYGLCMDEIHSIYIYALYDG